MHIEGIHIRPVAGLALATPGSVRLVAGQGIVGDRYFGRHEYPGQSLSLVEAEAIEAFLQLTGRPHDLTITARNLVTRGVALNPLVGREFTVGSVRLRGVAWCDPCSSLGNWLSGPEISRDEVIRFFLDKGGLRAEVLTDGEIHLGDPIQLIP